MGSRVSGGIAERRVSLNVPYDRQYEPKLLALISALVSIGRIPRCAVEEPVRGQNRMLRIFKLLKGCKVSVHDLCQVGSPPRFNIPFELGIAFTFAKLFRHHFIILESKRYRLDKTLSDLKGVDPFIHAHSPKRLISCILAELGSTRGAPDSKQVIQIFQHL